LKEKYRVEEILLKWAKEENLESTPEFNDLMSSEKFWKRIEKIDREIISLQNLVINTIRLNKHIKYKESDTNDK